MDVDGDVDVDVDVDVDAETVSGMRGGIQCPDDNARDELRMADYCAAPFSDRLPWMGWRQRALGLEARPRG